MARTMACPGWAARSEGIEQIETEWAQEGTAAHALAAKCLNTGSDAKMYLGLRIGKNVDLGEVSDEMVEAVQHYLDTCRDLIQEGDIWGVESKVSCEAYHPAVWGTCDFWRFRSSTGELIIIDLKYGIKHAVSVIRNPQPMSYALGACLMPEVYGKVLDIQMAICQPRGLGEPVQWEHIGPAELYAWGYEMRDAVTAAENATRLDLVAGNHCTFCPALGVCEVAESHAMIEYDHFNEANSTEIASFTDPASYSPEGLQRALLVIPFARQWCSAVEQFATAQAEKGHTVPGFKLKTTYGHRQWKSELAVKNWCEENDMSHHLYAPAKIKSPAQMEKALGKQYADYIEDLWVKPERGAKLVPIATSAEEKAATIDLEFQPRQIEEQT